MDACVRLSVCVRERETRANQRTGFAYIHTCKHTQRERERESERERERLRERELPTSGRALSIYTLANTER
jgi:hypothetical protein